MPASSWLKVERELRELDAGPVDSDSHVSIAVLGKRRTHSLARRRLHETPVIVVAPADIAPTLDRLLWSLRPQSTSFSKET